MAESQKAYDLYRDVKERCNGEIYIGVLGPVRTGKSTFISRFMEEMVFPNMEEGAEKIRATDELPQSAAGKTITTTEPKFVPKEAASIRLGDDVTAKVRLIDCVGYMVEGAVGHFENEEERMVKTPWFDDPIPFSKAAEIGTDKVMKDHSTIGLVITTDGSIGELPRDAYLEAEEKTITALKETGKPFLVLVNSKKPYSEEAKNIASRIEKTYGVMTMTVNCKQLRKEDVIGILEQILFEFPVSSVEFHCPGWMRSLDENDEIIVDLIGKIKDLGEKSSKIRDVTNNIHLMESSFLRKYQIENLGLSDGVIKIEIDPKEECFYNALTNTVGENIKDSDQLMMRLRKYGEMKEEYDKVKDALDNVKASGYGVVIPSREEITLEEPEIIHQGNKYGVKIKAISPSIHMIRTNVVTEIAPIVGTKEQAEDLITFIKNSSTTEGMWATNVFGKSVEQMVNDGIHAKISGIGPESREKLQDCMQKIVNESNGGMVCIII